MILLESSLILSSNRNCSIKRYIKGDRRWGIRKIEKKDKDAISERVKTIEKQERLGRTKNHSKKKMKKRTTIVDRYIKQVDVYLRVNEKKI